MNSCILAHAMFLATALRALAASELVLAESTFDDPAAGTAGWHGINNDGRNETLLRLTSSVGDGDIQLREEAGDSATMLFLAPAEYLGDHRAAYGGHLAFDLRQFRTDQFYNGADVTLESGGVLLNYSFGRFPGRAWEHFEVPLMEGPR